MPIAQRRKLDTLRELRSHAYIYTKQDLHSGSSTNPRALKWPCFMAMPGIALVKAICMVVWQCWLESDYVCPGLPQSLGFLLPQSPKWSAGITDILQYPVRKCSIYDNLQFPQPGPQSSSIYYSLLDSNVTCTFSEIFGIETDSLLTSNSLLSLNCPVMTQCHSPGNLMIKRNWLVLGFRGQELWDQGAGIWRMPSCHAIPRQKVKGQASAGGSETLYHTGSNFTETDFPRIRATLIYSHSNGQNPTNYWWAIYNRL